MNILITGGFGYLGGRIAQSLYSQGHDIILGSRKIRSSPEWLQTAKVVKIKWDSLESLKEILKDVDIVIHAAGINAQDCASRPVEAIKFNGVATARLVKASKDSGVTKFIYLSTAHVYNSPLIGKITEESCCTNKHPYATSHRAGEDVVRLAHKNNRIEGVVIRLSNSFGAPVNQNANCWMLLVNDICKQVVCERKIVLKSDGKQKINFITMSDACHAIEYLTSLDASKLDDGVFNVGGKLMNIMEMALLVKKRSIAIFNYQSEITHKEIKQNILIPDFEFNTDKILSSGLVLNGDYNYEVDGLLLACKSFYGTMS